MRPTSILREAALNIATGTTRFASLTFALVLVLLPLAVADIASVASLDHEAQRYRDSGGSTLIYTMEGGINGAACDALGTVHGVIAAGAIRQRDAGLTIPELPDEQVPTFEVSPAFGRFRALGKPSAAGNVLVSSELAKTLGLTTGKHLRLAAGSPRLEVFGYAEDGRRPGLGYSVLVPADSRAPFDECWLETWPVAESFRSLMSTTLKPGAVVAGARGPTPRLQQLNASLGSTFDGAGRYGERVTRFAPAVGGVATFALGFFSVWRRRLELAAARHSRVTPKAQALQILIETGAWTTAGVLLVAPMLSILVGIANAGDPRALIELGVKVLEAGPIALLGAMLAVSLVREKHLFRYFKTR
ncbi:hypothetical protein [Leifsonia poae]|uniref:hypothetical protein n=1 Tax=Leifsonia poae TaxID=110933 RepID=UPI003D67220D